MLYKSVFYCIILWLLLLLTSGCSPHAPIVIPEVESGKFPLQFSIKTGDFKDSGKWWLHLKSEQLNQIVDEGLSHNHAVLASKERIGQTLASKDIAWSRLFPSLNLGVSKGKNKTIGNSTLGSATIDSASLSMSASYEIDLFAKNSSELSAVELDLLASVEDHKSLLQETAKNIVFSWLRLLELNSQIELSRQTLEAEQESLSLINGKYRLGTARFSDVLQAQRQVLQLRSQLLDSGSSFEQAALNLTFLLGRMPGEIELREKPKLDIELPPINAGLPSELLKRRHDVRSAIARVKSADFRVGVAVAARFPSLSLTASSGYHSESLSDIVDPGNMLWNLIGNLALPLFDAGGRKAEVVRREKLVQERLINYRSTLIQAINEVELALRDLHKKDEKIELLSRQKEVSGLNLKLIKEDYRQGIVDWFQVITIQSQFYTAQRNQITAQREKLEIYVSLLKALGGSWADEFMANMAKNNQ
ncbi:MAG: efflux transporter outer membrane subunit [Deltaproteobacteria bacterium]|nr:efflux transporter outer membrane subunit [Deltaproteobacteria bacterium]